MPAILTLQNLTKSYSGRLVLSVPAVDIAPGIHWLKGQNGFGKTTLFKVIAGLLPYAGTVLLDGQFDLRRHPVAYRLRVNYGEAEPVYPEFLTGWELIHWVATAKQAPQHQVDALIDRFAVADFLKTPVGTYSSGMLKKVSIIMAFLGNPRLILLDEPLITLDQQATHLVAELIQTGREQGISFLLSSHQDFSLSGLPVESVWQVAQQTLTLVPHTV
ncbi:ABC transporter ATP-binding protein [Nibrella viscosa]